MSELSQLSPQPLWDIFAKICSIPHPSYHEEQLAEHIMGWAKEKVCTLNATKVSNILIRKPATAGMEKRKPVVLQAHRTWCHRKQRHRSRLHERPDPAVHRRRLGESARHHAGCR